MPRKKKPQIIEEDDTYTSDFKEFQKLPTNKPKEIQQEIAEAEPAPVPQPAAQPVAEAIETPTKPKSDDTPADARQGRGRGQAKADAPPAKRPATTPRGSDAEKREVALAVAVKVEQVPKLEALETKGIAQKDVITLAGRRAVERFEPQAKFVDKADAERMPMREGYKSSKRIDAALLDKLRSKHDPLGLSSDGAMIRGQFEPLFWTCLDEVIQELNSRFK